MTRLAPGLIIIALCCCSKRGGQIQPAPVAVESTAPTAHVPSMDETIKAAPTLHAAMQAARPLFIDHSNMDSIGSIEILDWLAAHGRWSDIGVDVDETNFVMVQKDVDSEIGHRLCVGGTVVEITKDQLGANRTWKGEIVAYSGNIFRFLGARSSGQVVAQGDARFCGVVTGLYDYSNSGGGVTHAVEVVGMFDLPENRAFGVSVAAPPQPPPGTARPPSTTGACKPPFIVAESGACILP